MAKRPWITPEAVKAYTDFALVKNRSDEKLRVDITRAEQYVISYTHNTFEDTVKFPEIPEAIKTAVILVAESYAHNAAEGGREYKSETFDDYSYTLQDGRGVGVGSLDLGPLLDDYVIKQSSNTVIMKLRKL